MFRRLPLGNNSYRRHRIVSSACLFPFLVLLTGSTFPILTMRLTACLTRSALLLSLAACAQPAHKPVAVFSPAAQAELEQIRTHFHDGDYGAVIRQVARSSTLPAAAPSQYSEALKLQAFSFCVRDHVFLCEDRFKQAMAVDPNFALAQAEQGHPTWGPVYAGLQKEQP